MKIDISPELAVLIDKAIGFTAMGDPVTYAEFRRSYLSMNKKELATFSHQLQELAYGEAFVQKAAMTGEYNPERFTELKDEDPTDR